MTTHERRRARTNYVARVGTDPDHPIEVMRRDWRRGVPPVARPDMFELTGGIGANERNGRDDVARIEQALSLTGDLDLEPTEGPTGHFSNAKGRAIRRFQDRNDLRVDGQILPGGSTVRTLRSQLVSTDSTRDVSSTRERRAVGEATGGPTVRARRGQLVSTDPTRNVSPARERRAAGEASGGPTVRALRGQLVSTDSTRNVSPARERRVAGEASGGRREGEGETQVAIGPLVLAAPAVVAAWPSITTFAGWLLGGAALAAVVSLRGDTLQDGTEPAGDDSEARHREALVTRGVEMFLESFQPGYQNSRGNDDTQRGNSIIVEKCEEILREEFPEFEDRVKHTGGATQGGKGKVKVKETYFPNTDNLDNPRLGSTRPDVSFTFDGKEKQQFHFNTADMLADGTTPNARERHQLEKLARLSQRIVSAVRKLRPGTTDAEYAEEVRKICRDAIQNAIDEYDREETEDTDDE